MAPRAKMLLVGEAKCRLWANNWDNGEQGATGSRGQPIADDLAAEELDGEGQQDEGRHTPKKPEYVV